MRRGTEGVEAPVPQGARSEHTGRMRPTSNAAGPDAATAECRRIYEMGSRLIASNDGRILSSHSDADLEERTGVTGRRGIPLRGVARGSHTPGMLSPRTWWGGPFGAIHARQF